MNDTDDSKIFNERIEPIKDKMPDLNKLHTYGSEDNELVAEKRAFRCKRKALLKTLKPQTIKCGHHR